MNNMLQQQTGTSSNPQNKTNQQNSTTKDYKNLNYQNFKTVSDIALKYFQDQEQKFEDKAIDKFNSLNNFYNEIIIKDEVQQQLGLSSNKIVDFPNFGNLSIDSMESIDSNTDSVCKFSNQVYSKNKKNEKTTETMGGDTSVIKNSKIDEMQKAISTLVKYDLKRSSEPIIEAIRTTYSMDQSIKALNQLETFLVSDNIKTAGVNYTPKSIINLVIKLVKLNKDPNSQQLTQEEQSTRNEIFKILYDVLTKIQNNNIDSKIIVFYIESINNVKEFTDYCNQQQPPFDFNTEVNKHSSIVQATAQLNNNKAPTISQSTSSTASKTADQIILEPIIDWLNESSNWDILKMYIYAMYPNDFSYTELNSDNPFNESSIEIIEKIANELNKNKYQEKVTNGVNEKQIQVDLSMQYNVMKTAFDSIQKIPEFNSTNNSIIDKNFKDHLKEIQLFLNYIFLFLVVNNSITLQANTDSSGNNDGKHYSVSSGTKLSALSNTGNFTIEYQPNSKIFYFINKNNGSVNDIFKQITNVASSDPKYSGLSIIKPTDLWLQADNSSMRDSNSKIDINKVLSQKMLESKQ